jgi:hypothetical protein
MRTTLSSGVAVFVPRTEADGMADAMIEASKQKKNFRSRF